MKRLINAAVAFAVTLVAYQVYVLAVVPVVEPTIAVRPLDPATEEEWRTGAHAVGRWQEILAYYFPEGHWSLTGTPQVYEYGPMALVLDDFRPNDRGEVQITKCVMLAFPTPRQAGAPPPRDAVIVEAPDNVTIVFDQLDPGLDFTSGKIGKPIAGRFPGELVIRSDMNEPGSHDDLRLVTRDLTFNQAMLYTRAPVDLRLGPHHAHGREMEIRLLREQFASRSKSPVAGVESLEIRKDVRVVVEVGDLDAGGALRSDRRVTFGSQRTAHGPIRQVAAEQPLGGAGPLELTSAGPFRFDFQRFVASFEEDVRARLARPAGPSDQLFCRQLSLSFADARGDSAAIDPNSEPEVGRAQTKRLADLRPQVIEAVGRPVRLESPSRQAAVRGERVRAWIEDRRLRIEGAPASLVQGLSEAQAPMLEYQAPAPRSGRTIGEFLAAGPGWLRLTPSATRPDRTFEAQWNAGPRGEPSVRLARDQRGEPVLSMSGRPAFAAGGFGKLRADRVDVKLRESPADGPDGPAIELGDSGAILPQRVDASGDVQFVGRQLEGSADDLVALLRPVDANTAVDPTGPALGSPVGFAKRSRARADQRRFRVKTRTIQLDIGLAGPRALPISLVCDGGVRLDEQPRADGKQPLAIVGSQLRADRLDRRGQSRLTIAGGPTPEGEGLAELSAQGLHVWVRDLHVDQAAGRAWTEGRGDARLELPSRGDELLSGGEATLRWRGGMDFDGERLVVRDEVFAETTDGWLQCSALGATLTRPIDLRGGSLGGDGSTDLGAVECSGGVTIDYRSRDDAGQRSHERIRMERVAFERASGALVGDGPGSIRSVRLGRGGFALPKQQAPKESGAGLRFLRVDFRQAMHGNLNDRAIRFRGGVEAVYGPVLAWEHQLPLRSPDGVPPDSVEIRCEQLRVHEDPGASVGRGASTSAPLGPVELIAERNVRIEATIGDDGGALIAEAASASYAQAADRLDLAGDAQQLARMWIRADATQPFVPTTVGRLTHYPSLGKTKIHDIRGMEYQPPASATRPAAPRR